MSHGVSLYAVPGALVEALILQLTDVGYEGDIILAVFGSHVVFDVVRIHGFGHSAEGEHKQGQGQKHRKDFLHSGFPP